MKKPKDSGKGKAIIKVQGSAEHFSKITGTTKSGTERILLQMASMAAWCRDMTREQQIHAAAELIAELEPANLPPSVSGCALVRRKDEEQVFDL